MECFVVKSTEVSEMEDGRLCLRVKTKEGENLTIILERIRMNAFLMGLTPCDMIGTEISCRNGMVSFDGLLWVTI